MSIETDLLRAILAQLEAMNARMSFGTACGLMPPPPCAHDWRDVDDWSTGRLLPTDQQFCTKCGGGRTK